MRPRLQQLLKNADAFDLSWSLTEGGVERRALVGWLSDHAPYDELAQIALDWGMNAPMVNRWRESASESEGVGLTVNAALSSFRLYTHRWKGIVPNDYGAVVYTGYKCLPDGTVRVDEYQNYGDLREADNVSYAMAHTARPEWVERVIALAPKEVPLMFTRIANSGRQSWLVTVRHAKLDAGIIIGKEHTGLKLLHLAGGIDAAKGAFDTFYLGSSPTGVAWFLGSASAGRL